MDSLVVAFLCAIPIMHGFLPDRNTTMIVQQICIALCYTSLRVISSLFRCIVVLSLFAESVLLVFMLNVLIGISQYLGFSSSYYPELGPTGIFFNPGPYAIYLSALIPWALVCIVNNTIRKRYARTILGLLVGGLALFLIAVSFSRSAWMGLFCGIALPLILFYGKTAETYNKVKMLLVFVIGSALFYWVLYGAKIDSSNGRILIWKVSSTMAKEHWATGAGTGKFPHLYLHYQKKFFDERSTGVEQYKNLAGDVRFAFNDFLQMFVEGGILSAVLFAGVVLCAVLFLVLRISKQRNVQGNETLLLLSGGMISSLIVVLAAGLTAYPLQVLPISLLFWALIALAVTMFSGRKNEASKSCRIVLAALLTLLNVGVLCYGIQKAKAYILFAESPVADESIVQHAGILQDYPDFLDRMATMHKDKGNVQTALKYMGKALSYDPSPTYYYKMGGYHEAANEMERAFEVYDFVDKAIPNLLTPKYLKSLLFYKMRDTSNFIIHAEETMNFTPKVYTVEVVDMRKDLRRKSEILKKRIK